MPGLALCAGIACSLTPAGAPASRFWWTMLGVFCVPPLAWLAFFVGCVRMWRRGAKRGR